MQWRPIFFFPCYHTGGAEKVHADIAGVFATDNPLIFISRPSRDRNFFAAFNRAGRVVPLWALTIRPSLRRLLLRFLAGFVNRQHAPVLFGGNCLLFYDLLPYLQPSVRCVDLLHAVGGGLEYYSLPQASRLDARVVIDDSVRVGLAGVYAEAKLQEKLLERVVVIPNRTEVPPTVPCKDREGPLKVLYVGRDSGEKRVHLIGNIARACNIAGVPAVFTLVGDLTATAAAYDLAPCRLAGALPHGEELLQHYAESHILLLTSEREGFPLVVMEAMAHGVVPITTAVGGIPGHISHGSNGFLLPGDGGDSQVVNSAVTLLIQIAGQREMLDSMSSAAHAYATRHFAGQDFAAAYRRVLLGDG